MRRRTIGLGLAAICSVAACSGDDDAAPETTAVASTTTLVARRAEDGKLTLGVLLPPNDSLVGGPLREAVRVAVSEINQAGGVLGEPVATEFVDEGTGAAAIGQLIEADVDAVVGPASSLIALNGLGDLVAAGVLTCSPTATALALDAFPDAGLFMRTIPSDSMQADVIAREAGDTGRATAVIAHVDDAFGRPFAEAVEAAVGSRGIEVVDAVPFSDRDEDFSDEAQALAATDPEIAIVIGTGEDSARFLVALDQQEELSSAVRVLVNSDIRTPDAQPLIASLSPAFRSRITGLGPQAAADPGTTPWEPDGAYAANAYDCVNLLALASVLAESTIGSDLTTLLPEISTNGRVCADFGQCTRFLDENLNFDYVGPTGVLEMDTNGERSRANFVRFDYDETGRDTFVDSFTHPV